MRVLLDMRPALDGHSGIPQETRMLFAGLAATPGVQPVGLIQSGNLVLESGLPLTSDGVSIAVPTVGEQAIDRLSQVVVSLQQGPASHKLAWLRKRFLEFAGPMSAGAASLVGLRTKLSGFDATHFSDFLWRSMFAKSLPVSDLQLVMACQYRVLRWPWSRVNQVGVATAALGYATYPRLDTRGSDIFVGQTPYPGRVHKSTRMVIRYHDAMPLLLPHTVRNRGFHRDMHFHALRRNVRDGAWFACDSDASRADLLTVAPQAEDRSVTIPVMVSPGFCLGEEEPRRVPEIIWSRKNRDAPHGGGAAIAPDDDSDGGLRYLLMVSTVEPRKNHEAVVDAWELLRARGHERLHLVCVGSLGWDHGPMLKRFEPWLQRGGLHLLSGVPVSDLRVLYRNAAVTVCPSFSEGFDLTGAESMCSGGIVAASDIRVHRDVYGRAAEYFNPYSSEDMAATLARTIERFTGDFRAARVAEGIAQASRYRPEVVMPQWHRFLGGLVGAKA